MTIGEVSYTSTLGQIGQTQQTDKSGEASMKSDTADQVKLSTSATAKHLYSSGQSVQEIAARLGMSTQIVSQYLGITTATENSLLAAAK